MTMSCNLLFEDLKDCPSNSAALDAQFKCRKCGKFAAEHPCLRNANQLSNRKCVFILFHFEDDIPCPQGTAFAINVPTKNILLTAVHNIMENKVMKEVNWFITTALDRDADGWIANGPYMPVMIKSVDMANGIAIFCLSQANFHFPDEEVLKICPREDVPSVLEEQEFKTYYCPIGDIESDLSFPSLSIVASPWKKAYSIQKAGNGKMWIKGGLCNGASGGVVVNKHGHAIGLHLKSLLSTKPVKSNGYNKISSSTTTTTTESTHNDEDDDYTNYTTVTSQNIDNFSQVCSILPLNSQSIYNFNQKP